MNDLESSPPCAIDILGSVIGARNEAKGVEEIELGVSKARDLKHRDHRLVSRLVYKGN